MDRKAIIALAEILESKGEPNYKRCGLSYDSFWYAIRNFEKEVGLKLVTRKDKFIPLTAAGKVYAHKAQKILKLMEQANQEAKIAEASLDNMIPLVVATTRPLSSAWVLPAIQNFQNQHLGEVAIYNDDYLSPLTQKIADVFVRPITEHVTIEPLWRVKHEYGLFASQEYLEKNGVPKTGNDLISHRIISYGDTLFTGLMELDWHINGTWADLPPLTPYLRTNSTSETARAAQLGLGISTVPTESVKIYDMKLERVLPYVNGPTYYTTIGITRSLNDYKREAAIKLCDLVKEQAEKKGIQVEKIT